MARNDNNAQAQLSDIIGYAQNLKQYGELSDGIQELLYDAAVALSEANDLAEGDFLERLNSEG